MRVDVERRARRQIVGPIDQPRAVGVRRLHGVAQRRPFFASNRRDGREHRRRIDAADRQSKGLAVVGPAIVVKLQHHLHAGRCGDPRSPCHHARLGVDGHPVRPLPEHPRQHAAFGIIAGRLVGGDAARRRQERRLRQDFGRRIGGEAARHAKVERDRRGIGGIDRDGAARDRGAGRQQMIGGQRAAEVDQPGAVGGAALRALRLAGEWPPGVNCRTTGSSRGADSCSSS